MNETLWMIEYEQACDDFIHDGDKEMFTARLKSLGFDNGEILDEMEALIG